VNSKAARSQCAGEEAGPSGHECGCLIVADLHQEARTRTEREAKSRVIFIVKDSLNRREKRLFELMAEHRSKNPATEG
jgi:hypothetical protein